jgi:hypothetical protein
VNGFLLYAPFRSLAFCLFVLVDWTRFFKGPAAKGSRVPGTARWENAVYALLLCGAVGAGALDLSQGWPFSVYPTFAAKFTATRIGALDFEALAPGGRALDVDPPLQSLRATLGSARWMSRSAKVLLNRDRDDARAQTLAIWRELVALEPSLRQAASLRVIRLMNSTDPDDWARNPVARSTVATIDLMKTR